MTEADAGSPRQLARLRPTARLILLDDADRVLLFKFEDHSVYDPNDPRGATRSPLFWATPGGGVEEGETYEEAALRELWEETGLTSERIGPCIHEDEKLLVLIDERVLFQQRFFFVLVPTSTISLSGFTPLEKSVYRDHHWWGLAELESTTETVFPENLPEIIRRALDMR